MKKVKNKVGVSDDSVEVFYNFMTGNSGYFFHIVDKNMNIIFANPAMIKKLGYIDLEDIKGTSLLDIFKDPIPSEQLDSIIKTLVEKGRINFENQWKTNTGEIIDGEVTLFTIYDSNREYNGVNAIFYDITERKKSEKALIESQRLSAIGEMTSAIAHDFNNSLQSILGNAQLAMLSPDISKKVCQYLETVIIAASDAAVRVQLLQRFGGKSNGNGHYSPIDLNVIVRDVITQSRPLWKDDAAKSGLLITINTKYGKISNINGNDSELRSVVYNIVKNCVEAMPEGGQITLETGEKSNNVFLRITDSGKGMDDETKKRIFQPFYTTKGFETGRGLGMSGSFSIIKEHEGEICVIESTLGKGTSIEILLPSVKEEVIVNRKEVTVGYEVSARVLWVDDDSRLRSIAKDLLEEFGHTGDVVSSGAEALEYLDKNQYDLVITDIGMPEMSGKELAIKIKKKFDGKMKVIAFTGWGPDEISDEDKKEYGIGFVLGKPIKLKILENAIGEVMQLNNK